jgi:hypothetical protein
VADRPEVFSIVVVYFRFAGKLADSEIVLVRSNFNLIMIGIQELISKLDKLIKVLPPVALISV